MDCNSSLLSNSAVWPDRELTTMRPWCNSSSSFATNISCSPLSRRWNRSGTLASATSMEFKKKLKLYSALLTEFLLCSIGWTLLLCWWWRWWATWSTRRASCVPSSSVWWIRPWARSIRSWCSAAPNRLWRRCSPTGWLSQCTTTSKIELDSPSLSYSKPSSTRWRRDPLTRSRTTPATRCRRRDSFANRSITLSWWVPRPRPPLWSVTHANPVLYFFYFFPIQTIHLVQEDHYEKIPYQPYHVSVLIQRFVLVLSPTLEKQSK